MQIQVKKLSDEATIPTRANDGDAGYDLYATEDYVLKPGERKLFKTNIAIAIPKGYYGRIAPRSGLAYKNGIEVLGGVIDSSYRNDVGVILINLNLAAGSPRNETLFAALSSPEKLVPVPLTVKKGDRIAQIVIEKYHDVEWEEVKELDETNRNLGGFGSSGR